MGHMQRMQVLQQGDQAVGVFGGNIDQIHGCLKCGGYKKPARRQKVRRADKEKGRIVMIRPGRA
ncbi:hypothetical protein MACH17_12670 [Phaeobacter inhibens]|nr:hypothetical protein MACH17_12670 [Phaeobacter inhibens]